jgi:hypothetical protein
MINLGLEKMNYAKQYAEAVQRDMATYRNAYKTYFAGKQWKVCGNSSYSMCITPVKNFQIPLEITELVSVGTVVKPYVYQLSFGLVMEWGDDMIISYYDGNRWEFPNQCDSCGDICRYHYWDNPVLYMCMCPECYQIHADHEDEDWNEISVVDFNVMEWVRFMQDGSVVKYNYYVNCNLDSLEYGNIIVITGHDKRSLYNIGNVHIFHDHILCWLKVEYSDISYDDVIQRAVEFLDRYFNVNIPYIEMRGVKITVHGSSSFTNRDALNRKSKIIDEYTNQVLISYIHVLKPEFPNHSHHRIRAIAEKELREAFSKLIFTDSLTDCVKNKLYIVLMGEGIEYRMFSRWIIDHIFATTQD